MRLPGPEETLDRPELSQDRSTEGPLQLILARALRLSRMSPPRWSPLRPLVPHLSTGGALAVEMWIPLWTALPFLWTRLGHERKFEKSRNNPCAAVRRG